MFLCAFRDFEYTCTKVGHSLTNTPSPMLEGPSIHLYWFHKMLKLHFFDGSPRTVLFLVLLIFLKRMTFSAVISSRGDQIKCFFVKITHSHVQIWWMLLQLTCRSAPCIQGEPVQRCPRNPIDQTKLEAWTWQPFYIINSEWLESDQCREFYTFLSFKHHIYLPVLSAPYTLVCLRQVGRMLPIGHVNVALLGAENSEPCGAVSNNVGTGGGFSSPDRLFENGLFLCGGTLTNHAPSGLKF